jgi:hypothetical protein
LSLEQNKHGRILLNERVTNISAISGQGSQLDAASVTLQQEQEKNKRLKAFRHLPPF